MNRLIPLKQFILILTAALVVCSATTAGLVYLGVNYFPDTVGRVFVKSSTQPSSSSSEQQSQNNSKTSTYVYDYLGIAFDYPEGWKVSVVSNPYNYMLCDHIINVDPSLLRNPSMCEEEKLYPENLIIQGPSGEVILLWNVILMDTCCPDSDKEINVKTYGGSHTITLYENTGGTISTFS